jgi:hypothetical protein
MNIHVLPIKWNSRELGMDFEKCKDVLIKEIELVRRVSALQNSIREAVINRNWTDFEGYFSAPNGIGGEFSSLESERERFFPGDSSAAAQSMGFYAQIARFPAKQRRELSEIYRNLKLETMRVQISGEAIMEFITGARATIASFFEIAFPDRGGKMYTPYGRPVSHDMRSMVLNHRF